MSLPQTILTLLLATSVVSGCRHVAKQAYDYKQQADEEQTRYLKKLADAGIKNSVIVISYDASASGDRQIRRECHVYIQDFKFTDLSLLRGMGVTTLCLDRSTVSHLSPLAGMHLTFLRIGESNTVSDLTPLKGMPLEHLILYGDGVSDLTPLDGMALKTICFNPKHISAGIDVLRHMKSLECIAVEWEWEDVGYGLELRKNKDLTPDDFWKTYDAGEL